MTRSGRKTSRRMTVGFSDSLLVIFVFSFILTLSPVRAVAQPAAAGDSRTVWLDVPFVKQEKEGCGPASIAMVMQYWQKQRNASADASADVLQIQRALYSSAAHGTYATDMERYFQEHRYRAFAFRGTWEDLRHHLEKGRPLIVALQPSPLTPLRMEAPLHYVVVAGVDWTQEMVWLNDPAQRKLLKQDRRSFEKEWNAVANWTLLAVPRPAVTQPPVTPPPVTPSALAQPEVPDRKVSYPEVSYPKAH